MSPWQTPLSLSLLIKGVSAIVDGAVIYVNVDSVAVDDEEKRIEVVLTRSDSRGLECRCVFHRIPSILVHVRNTPFFAHDLSGGRRFLRAPLRRRRIPFRGYSDSRSHARRFLFPLRFRHRFPRGRPLPQFVCSANQLLSPPSSEFPPFPPFPPVPLVPQAAAEGTSPSSPISDSRGKSEVLPIGISHLSPRGTWEELDPTHVIAVEGVSFEKQGFAESSVYAISNRGNIELSVILFHSKKSNGTVFLVDLDSNSKSKTLLLPPKSTKFFTLLVYDFETPEETPLNETDLVDSALPLFETPETGSIPFKFLFSSLRKFMLSFTFHVTKIAPSFAIFDESGAEIDANSFFPLEIAEQSSGSYAFKTLPVLHVGSLPRGSTQIRNLTEKAMKLALLDTCPYYALKPSAGKQIRLTEFGGRFIELAGNEDFALTVELIVEMFLDRLKMSKVAPIFGVW